MKVKRISGNRKILHEALEGIQGYIGKVGWVERKKYPDSNMTTAEVAAITEEGSTKHNIPPRPVVKPAIVSHRNRWKQIMFLEAKKILKGTQTTPGALEILVLEAAGEIRRNITQLTSPPLKIATIKARERQYAGRRKTLKARKIQIAKRISAPGKLDKPLVFTKYYLNSCTGVVVKE